LSEGQTKEIRITIPEELFSALFPKKAMGHLIKAKKEMLLALRSLVDARIDALEKMEKEESPKKKADKKKKIKID
jgi:hypothetical protein